MTSAAHISQVLPPPMMHAHNVVKFHNTQDIIKHIEAAHANNIKYAKKFAHTFKRPTVILLATNKAGCVWHPGATLIHISPELVRKFIDVIYILV
jgi:hypothetical protein